MSSSGVVYPAQPEKILKALGQVWTSLAKEEQQHQKPTVLRACAMTLIVATDDTDGDQGTALQTLIGLMHEHPSRSVVLRVSETVERGLEARVLAQCWKPFGKAQQICCEQIEISAHPQSWAQVGPTVNGILAADLPVVLWCRQKAALNPAASDEQKTGLAAVMDFAGKAIVDTAGSDLRGAYQVIKKWRQQGRIIGDLQWTRLTPWRQALANAFDDPGKQRDILRYKSVEVGYAGADPDAAILYIAGWLSAVLDAHASLVRLDVGQGTGLQRVTLRSDTDEITLQRTSDQCMTLRVGGRQRKYTYSELSLYTLMNEELSILGPDPVFESAIERALEIHQA
ncbi:MAG TPA: glucose-6-phosphate dehydrogenase assembly protein OpcA [Bryobacteraceae bacterium]|jgi:glucose-6-phosphate dehydrogenase assembly protein OpcA|nr:glucose-6-phosphate dehydrogenase assembly protein OpcA [Bryobacteraceae bacterium]